MQYPHLNGMPSDDLVVLISEAKQALVDRRRSERFICKSDKQNDAANVLQTINTDVAKYNASMPLTPRHHLAKRKLAAASQYLPALLKQDWHALFQSEAYSTERKYYVYAHMNPSLPRINAPDAAGGIYAGTPFYIGKGVGDRAYDLKRNQGHGKTLEKLQSRGFTKSQIVKIIFDELTESEAYEIESKLIYFFGTIYGHSRGVLYNLETPKIPRFVGQMKPMNFILHTNDNQPKLEEAA